jgi:hypothetical protein
MTQRSRKFFGTVLLLASIIGFGWVGSAVYDALLVGLPWWALIIFFAVLGGSWFIPAALIIRFMSKPDQPSRPQS